MAKYVNMAVNAFVIILVSPGVIITHINYRILGNGYATNENTKNVTISGIFWLAAVGIYLLI